MIHQSELGEHAERFPTDANGHVPEENDHWSLMSFDHGPHDPAEPGISDDEKQRRTEYLDKTWWPQVIAQVNEQRAHLDQLPGGNPIRQWRERVMPEPSEQHGFEVDELE